MNERKLEHAREAAVGKLETADWPLRALESLVRALLDSETSVDGVLTRLVHAARFLIPGADVVSITLRRGEGDYYTPVRTDEMADELDRLQYAYDEGPCLDAADPDGPAYAHSDDLAGETPWPDFASGTVEKGYRSILSTALLTRPEPEPFTGALNIYAREPGGFGVHSRDMAFILATFASFALAAVHDREKSQHDLTKVRTEAANLRKALDTRTVIGQATGILMARRELDADGAFEVLARASQNHNVKVVDLAGLLTAHPKAADRL